MRIHEHLVAEHLFGQHTVSVVDTLSADWSFCLLHKQRSNCKSRPKSLKIEISKLLTQPIISGTGYYSIWPKHLRVKTDRLGFMHTNSVKLDPMVNHKKDPQIVTENRLGRFAYTHETNAQYVLYVQYAGLKTCMVLAQQHVNGTSQKGDKNKKNVINHNRPTVFCAFAVHILSFSKFFRIIFKREKFYRSIRATDLGSESYLSSSPTNNNPHLLGPNQEAWKHQPRSKSKLTSSYFYVKS